MRAVWLAVFGACWAWPAVGQTLDGPLAAPAEEPPAAAHPGTAMHKETKAASRQHHRNKTVTVSGGTASPLSLPPSRDALPLPRDHAKSAVPGSNDPVSFGMKWNGANDDALRTRTQNYDGNAAGTGAEVGMKLHF